MTPRNRLEPEYLEGLGSLALATRVRRLADRLASEVGAVYRREGTSFQPRWFGVFHLLSERAPLSIRQCAETLGVSHTAVSQAVKEMQRARLVSSTRDRSDARCRRLSLTQKGEALLDDLQPLWRDFENGSRRLLEESDCGFLRALAGVEAALDRESLSDRISRCREDGERQNGERE